MNVAQQAEARLVVHAVGDHELGPAVERDVEGIRIAKALRIAAEDELLLVLAELFEDVIRDMGVSQLVLDDGDAGHERVDGGRPLRGEVIGGRRDQLGVTGNDEGVLELAQVLGGHLAG